MNTAKKMILSTPDVGAVGIESTALFGIPVTLFVWDGTETHASTALANVKDWKVKPCQGSHVLFITTARTNASLSRGGWVLMLGNEIHAYGHRLPNAKMEQPRPQKDHE